MVDAQEPEDRMTQRESAIRKSRAIMSQISTAKAQRMAYKDMPYLSYVTITISFYCVIVTGAIFILDISTIFDFASAISITALAFIFPGWFYLKVETKFRGGKIEDPGAHRLAIFFILLGIT